MRHRKLVATTALVAASALALSACGSTTKKSDTINNTASLTVGWNQPFYSLNQNTNNGNNVTNANVAYLTNSFYAYYDKDMKLQKDTSFGSYEKTSDSPLTIKQTLSDKAVWSDGAPVVNADTVLMWGAMSGVFNTVQDASKITNKDGSLQPNTGSQVYFDAGSPQLALIEKDPLLTADPNGKELSYKFKSVYADWEANALLQPGVPAHIAAKLALGIDDPTKANEAVVNAFKNDDKAALAKLSNVWNSSWNFTSTPSNKDLLVTDGPYVISEVKDKQYVQLTANPKYQGDHKPSISQLIITFNEDGGSQLTDLQNGKTAIIMPQATADLLKNAKASSNATVIQDNQASYEHVDLTFNNNGPFDPKAYGGDAAKALAVRQAFLMLIPRQEIVDKLIKPLNPDAVVRSSYQVAPDQPEYAATVKANGMDTAFPPVVNAASQAKAKELLAKAGVKTPVSVRFLYAKSNPRRQNEFQLIKSSTNGIFNMVDAGSDSWSSLLGGGTYDAALFAWSMSTPTLSGGESNYATGGGNNFSGYSDATVNSLFKELGATLDSTKQFELNNQIEKKLVDDAFGTIIFQFPNLLIYNKNMVTGVSDAPLTPNYFWNFWEWKLPNS